MRKINWAGIGSTIGNGFKAVGGGIATGWGFLKGFWTKFRTLLVNLWPWVNALFIWLWILMDLANNLVYGTFVAKLFTTQNNPNFPAEIVRTVNIITVAVMVILALCSRIPKTDELRRTVQIAIIVICGVLNALLGGKLKIVAMAILAISVFAEVIFMDKHGKRSGSSKDRLSLTLPDGSQYTLVKDKV